MKQFLIDVLIGIIIVVGFFIFWGRAEGWFKKGGLVHNWWDKKKNEFKEKHNKK